MTSSMGCVIMTIPDAGFTEIQHVEVELAINHNFVGDLVIKMQSPKGTITTLMNRPGAAEPVDGTFETPNGDDSNLDPAYPVRFQDGATISAESMGGTLGTGQIVCKDDQVCVYNPARGLGEGAMGLADFQGESPVGIWAICVGDGDNVDSGTITSATLSVLSY
jgi:subtilisin-like proprotein convertase family protein